MSEDIIRYDVLVQNALRVVVKEVLDEVAKTGIPGEHYFFISFMSNYPGVRMPQRVRDQYSDVMTIILQYQFWDLSVTEAKFSVRLLFGGVAETIIVPFASLLGFYDPSVQFGLQFNGDEQKIVNNNSSLADTVNKSSAGTVSKSNQDKDEDDSIDFAAIQKSTTIKGVAKDSVEDKNVSNSVDNSKVNDTKASVGEEENKKDGNSNRVVSLDSYRKK